MDLLMKLNWVALIPLIMLMTELVKKIPFLKNAKKEIINLITGIVLIGIILVIQKTGIDVFKIETYEAVIALLINPLVYDKWIKPFLDYFKSK